jgi:ATP-binding cassette subfamily C protein
MMYAIQGGSPAAFNVLLNAVNSFATEAMLFALICIGFLFVDPLATLAAVIYFGLIAFVMQYFVGSLMTKAGRIAAEGSVAANTAISDLLSVFRELLVLGKREKYIEGIYNARAAAADSEASRYYLSGMPRYIIEAALLVGVALFVLAQALAGDIVKSAATIGVFLSGGFRLTAALLPLQNALLTINAAIPSATTAHEILELPLSQEAGSRQENIQNGDPPQSPQLPSSNSPIGFELRGVSFSYPDGDQPALRNASFVIQPGTQVALMGPSGSGKSTIADLLCGVLTPSSGNIVRTGSTTDLGSESGFGRVSYVPQRPGLVSGTILDNVALAVSAEEVSRDQALEALHLANLTLTKWILAERLFNISLKVELGRF